MRLSASCSGPHLFAWPHGGQDARVCLELQPLSFVFLLEGLEQFSADRTVSRHVADRQAQDGVLEPEIGAVRRPLLKDFG